MMGTVDILMTIEEELTRNIQEVSKDLLLIEIPFRYRDQAQEAIQQFTSTFHREAFLHLSRQFPLTFARWLVDVAVDVYEDGRLWPEIARLLSIPEAWTYECGKAFYEIVRRFGLRTYDSGNLYVATILVHGGVPTQYLPVLFQLVKEAIDRLSYFSSGAQIMQKIKQSASLDYQARPIRRFLSIAPSAFVEEYLAEMADILVHGSGPNHRGSLRQGYRLYKFRSQRVSQSKGSARPYLRVGLEPEDISPIVLVLPERTTRSPQSPWRIITSNDEYWEHGPSGERLADGQYRHKERQVDIRSPITRIQVIQEDESVIDAIIGDACLFSSDGTFREERWLLQGETYYVFMAPGIRLIDTEIIRQEDTSFLGPWSDYTLLEIEALGSSVRWMGRGKFGEFPVVNPIKVTNSIRIRPREPAVIPFLGVPPLEYADRSFTVSSINDDKGITLMPDEIAQESSAVYLNISRALPTFGLHRVKIRGPFGISVTLDVDYGPSIEWNVPDSVRWPDSKSGQHRLGVISVFSQEATVSVAENWRVQGSEPGVLKCSIGVQEREIVINGRYEKEAFRRVIVCRAVTWEWFAHGHPPILNMPLRVTWDQFLYNVWGFNWQRQDDHLNMEINLYQDNELLKILGKRSPDQWHYLKDAIRDEIDRAGGRIFRLVARVFDENNNLRIFPIAFLERPLVSALNLRETGSKLIIDWKGAKDATVKGFVASVIDLFPLKQFSACGENGKYEVTIEHPKRRGPIVVSLGGDKGRAERFYNYLSGSLDTLPFNRELDRWIKDEGPAPIPQSPKEYQSWLECLMYLAPSKVARAVDSVVLPRLHESAGIWINTALLSSNPRENLFKLGVPQWNIIDQVGSRISSILIKKVPQIRTQSGVISWLVDNGCCDFDYEIATSVLGGQGYEVAQIMADGNFSLTDRRFLAALVKSPLFDAPHGESIVPPITSIDDEWLQEQMDVMGRKISLIQNYLEWSSNVLLKPERTLGNLAVLQRLAARGMAAADRLRVLTIQLALPPGWTYVYERELVRAELLCSVVEYIERRREDR